MNDTNEELVKRIQDGERSHIPQLWEQVQDFIIYLADRYLLNYPAHCRQLHGDMVNQAYFYFLKAVESYQPEKGKFITHLAYYVKNAFQEVLQGRSSRTRNEPLNAAVSLDKPMDETEDLTLADMLIDTQSEAYFRHLEDADLWRTVREMLLQGIEKLPEEYRDFFLVMLEHGTGVSDTLRIMKIDLDEKARYMAQYKKGLRRLYQHINVYLARQKGKDLAMEECIYYYSGFSAWVNHGYTSCVERAVMKRNDASFTAKTIGELMRKSG